MTVQYFNPAENQRMYAICNGIEFYSVIDERVHALEGRVYATVDKDIHWTVSVGHYKGGKVEKWEVATARIFLKVFTSSEKDNAFEYAAEKMQQLLTKEKVL